MLKVRLHLLRLLESINHGKSVWRNIGARIHIQLCRFHLDLESLLELCLADVFSFLEVFSGTKQVDRLTSAIVEEPL